MGLLSLLPSALIFDSFLCEKKRFLHFFGVVVFAPPPLCFAHLVVRRAVVARGAQRAAAVEWAMADILGLGGGCLWSHA